jgi:four helix bundle protein
MKGENGNRRSEIGSSPTASSCSGYRNLEAWKSSDDLAVEIFRLSQAWNRDLAWLKSQIMRAAVSVPANIAEGYARGSNREFVQFLTISHSSLAEVEYFLHFLRRTGNVSERDYERLRQISDRAGKILFGLLRSARSDVKTRTERRYLQEESVEYTTSGNEEYTHE